MEAGGSAGPVAFKTHGTAREQSQSVQQRAEE